MAERSPFDDPLSEMYVRRPIGGEYIVISATLFSIEEKVRNHMRFGWVPQGGICVAGETGQMRAYQAMCHPSRSDWLAAMAEGTSTVETE